MNANEPVAWRTHYPSGWEYKDGNLPFELKGNSQLLYTHPAQELNDGGEPVKNATYWKRQHDRLLISLNVSAIKIAELEKELKRTKFAWNLAENELERYLVKVKAQEK